MQQVREGGRVGEIVRVERALLEHFDRVRHEVLGLVGVVRIGKALPHAPQAQPDGSVNDPAAGALRAKAGMLRVAATYATFERRALLRQATAKPPDEADVVVDRIAAGLAFQIAFTSQPEVAVLAVTGSRFGYE